MALDEPKDTDEVFNVDGYTYLIEKALLAKAHPVKVDFRTIGFYITGNTADLGSDGVC